MHTLTPAQNPFFAEMAEKCTRHPIHIIIYRQVVCLMRETDQMVELLTLI